MYMYMYVHARTCMFMCSIYVGDGYITRPVLKPSDGFKAGPTPLNPAGWLDIWPDSFEAGQTTC